MRNHIQSFFLLLPLMLLFGAASVFAQGTAFTFQGKLGDNGSPVNGTFDMQFKLFDSADPNSSNQVGTTITLSNPLVQVTNGVFTVQLDFGAGALPGADRFLEIGIRRNSAEAYTLLSPRSQITSSPYAIRSLNATGADGMSTNCVACIQSSHINSVDASKIAGTVTNAALATNVTGVVAIANGGTGSSIKNFTDLTTDQTVAGRKNFVDPISGDGSGLTNIRGTVRWQVFTGTALQANSNTGYALTNSSQANVTLPPAPNVGDIVRVMGYGAGGWKITTNSGQSIAGAGLTLSSNWTPHESARDWLSVASSADGTLLVAVVSGGQIYISPDSGTTWIPRETNRNWAGVASSADGAKMVAVVAGGQIYTSNDSGRTWVPRESNRNWSSVASSSDGTKLVAVVLDGRIYTSTNSGATWTARDANRRWTSVASSANGKDVIAGTGIGSINDDFDVVYTSANFGITWIPRSALQWIFWRVASSADGRFFVTNGNVVFMSTDSGVSWVQILSPRTGGVVVSLASSADGTKLVAGFSNGLIFTSNDSGVTWATHLTVRERSASVASSADGTKLVAVVFGDRIFTYINANVPIGNATSLVGDQLASIELLYIGNGVFLPISHQGTIVGNY